MLINLIITYFFYYEQAKHKKNYRGSEELVRLARFTLVDQEIEQHNKNPHKTYEQGHNYFSDWVMNISIFVGKDIIYLKDEFYSFFCQRINRLPRSWKVLLEPLPQCLMLLLTTTPEKSTSVLIPLLYIHIHIHKN